MSEAWEAMVARGNACASTVVRTDPRDGPVRYMCSLWKDRSVYRTFTSVAAMEPLMSEMEAEHRAYMLERSRTRTSTPEEVRIHSMWAQLGGLTVAINVLGRQLSGAASISRAKLVMAESEGRNYLGELTARRAKAITERLALADELTRIAQRPKAYAEYAAAVRQLQAEEGTP